MNIFVLDEDPVTAARMHCDKHVVKMPLETAQLVSTALRLHGVSDPVLYAPTHVHSKVTAWVAESRENFEWALELGLALVQEHARRYSHTKAGREGHASMTVLARASLYSKVLPATGRTQWPMAMPELYKGADVVAAYRAYYRGDKARFATWRAPATTPAWW